MVLLSRVFLGVRGHSPNFAIQAEFGCNINADLRNELFLKAQSSHDMFLEWSMDDRFNYLMSNLNIVRHTAKACHLMLQRREHELFT